MKFEISEMRRDWIVMHIESEPAACVEMLLGLKIIEPAPARVELPPGAGFAAYDPRDDLK